MARSRSAQLTVGIILVAIGVILLATRLAQVSAAPAWLLGLGLAFSLLAIVQKSYGPLVAGMILLGIGAGMALGDVGALGLSHRAWRFLALGVGFAGIWAVGAVAGIQRHWWPLVVGAVLVAVGLAPFMHRLLAVPPEVEAFVRTWWPAALVAGGVVLLVRAFRS